MTKQNTITAKQALDQIKSLEYSFIGSRSDLHKKINEIISKVKQ